MNRPGQTRRFALPTALRSFALPNYRRWAAADLVSNVGSWMSTAALGWLVFATTGSAAALGAVVAVKQAPALLFGLLGGTFADRFDARRVLPFTQGAYAVLAAALAAVTLTGHAQVWHIYTYAVVTGALGVLDGPCFGRLLAQVLGPRHLSNGIALGSVTHSTGWVVGLGLGSAILARCSRSTRPRSRSSSSRCCGCVRSSCTRSSGRAPATTACATACATCSATAGWSSSSRSVR
jgi:MFS family permease